MAETKTLDPFVPAWLIAGIMFIQRYSTVKGMAAMTPTSQVQFKAKWKEELIGMVDGRRFTIELTMGILTVYLPTKSKWEATAPDWAKQQWERVKDDLSVWCRQLHIPLQIEENAWVVFE